MKSRVCVPSPWIVRQPLVTAWSTKAATTAPSSPARWRGPNTFDGRAMARGRAGQRHVPLGGGLWIP